ncbi:hypothetical protein KI387_021306, partial [Taxus chinensis]
MVIEPAILLDGDHSIDRTLEVAEKVRGKVFFYFAQTNVLFEGILLKPNMVTPGVEYKEKATSQKVAEYTLKMLKRRVTPDVPGIMPLDTLTWRVKWITDLDKVLHECLLLLDYFGSDG